MKIKAEVTMYYPADDPIEGGFLDALGNKLNPNHPTCACPPCIPFHTMIKVSGTNTKYDNIEYECLDRGSSIQVVDGIYHIDLLGGSREECNAFGRRQGYIEIIEESDNKVKTQNGFTRFDTIKEFETWLNKQKVTRKITRLQVHHMDLPNYNTWNTTDKKVFGDNRELGRTKSLDDYGKKTWNYSDGHGHYIAQHFNVFPNGKITTGRNLNSTPIGIKGWNTNAICVEIYGDFDKGKDVMTKEQKKAVIGLFYLLAKRFDIPINTSHIRPHCWFTAGGTYLGKYDSSKSAKTCPGTNFMGYGCSVSGFGKFITDVKNYKKPSTSSTTTTATTSTFKSYIVKVTCDELNARKGAGTSYDIECVLKKGVAVTVVAEKTVDGSKWGKCKSGYWINLNSKYVTKI